MPNIPLLQQLRALVEIDRAISFDNQNPRLYHQRATACQQLGWNALAIYDFRICAFLEQRNQDYYIQNYQPLCSEDEILAKFESEKSSHYYRLSHDILVNDKALMQDQIDPFNCVMRGGNLERLGLFNLALKDYNDAITHLEKFPQEYALACVNKAMLLNLVGDYAQGWPLYEKRWEIKIHAFKSPPTFPRPRWNGELTGVTRLLIHNEQGIGDNIQFVRYAIWLKQQGLDVLVWNNSHIDDFLTENLARYQIATAKQGDVVEFSHWIPMMSLPLLCGTTLDNIPFTDRYLTPTTPYRQKWQGKLPETDKTKIGVVWKGGTATDGDHIRSIPLETFSDLFDADTEFFCLQKELNENEVALLNQRNNVHFWHNELASFHDTAAIIDQMDLVIAVDTSVAHLAAAMGKPCWILINYKPDFRWLIEGEKSVWYQSVRLFRQDLDYEWSPVIAQIKLALKG